MEAVQVKHLLTCTKIEHSRGFEISTYTFTKYQIVCVY